MKNQKNRRRSHFKRLNPVFLCLCTIVISIVVLSVTFLLSKIGLGSPASCGIEGHLKGDGQNHKALKVSCGNGHHYVCECDIWTVPEGGTYYSGVSSASLGIYTGAKTIYTGGYKFPCGSVPHAGDVFVYKDYEYRYGYRYFNIWTSQQGQDGWGVKVLDTSKSSYEELLASINYVDVVSMCMTFAACSALVEAPAIPAHVTDMFCTFQQCISLISPPTLPSSVKDLTSCFDGCVLLAEPPVVPNGVTALVNTFQNCESLLRAPLFPDSLLDLTSTFRGCKSLKEVPVLPGSLLNLTGTFEGCESLTVTPEIPMTVSNMDNTFAGCRKLVDAPVIPSGVKSLVRTFSSCTLLSSAPKIPVEVINMRETFRDCASIKKAPNIPYEVIDMTCAFEGCVSLKGFISVFANPREYQHCFYRTQINEILGSTQLKNALLRTVKS